MPKPVVFVLRPPRPASSCRSKRSRTGCGSVPACLSYRRNATAGTWSISANDGRGGEWLKKFAVADDFDPADGKKVLSYPQALEAARNLIRGDEPGENPTRQ
jgi:hypothetical protein